MRQPERDHGWSIDSASREPARTSTVQQGVGDGRHSRRTSATIHRLNPSPTLLIYAAAAVLLGAMLCANVRAAPDDKKPPPVIPKRIITIAPNSAEIICALGACDRIVGVSKFCVHPPELKERPRVGGLFDPDLEKIITLRPDLVVLRGQSESVEQLCDELGVPVYRDRTEKLDDVATCIRDLGRRLGYVRKAEALVKEFHARLDAIRQRVKDKPRPRVLLTVSRQPDRLANILTTGRGTFLDEMLDVAGGVNVFGHLDMAYPQVSGEGIITHRPDVIIELMPEVRMTAALKDQMLEQWKQLGSIPAVSNERIHFLTEDHCLIPSLRYGEIINKVSRLLHPELQVD